METCSGYVPGQTFTVDPAGTAVTAAWMVENEGLTHVPTKTVAALADTATQFAKASANPHSIALPNLLFMESLSLTICCIFKPIATTCSLGAVSRQAPFFTRCLENVVVNELPHC